jgi:alpha-ketoglutaric semialdehyde dehydrogenase
MDITGDLLIGFDAVTRAERPLHGIDPATGETLDPGYVVADASDVARAADLAWAAYPVYRGLSLDRRADFLAAIAQNILDLGPQLVERAVAETGLTATRIETERTRTVFQLRLYADVVRQSEFLDRRIDPPLPHRQPIPKPDLRLRQIPLGPVAVFGSSNFPLAFSAAGGDTVSALAAGCPVVVKGHPAHPGTGELVARAVLKAAQDCGMPEGVYSLLTGGIDTGTALVAHPHIKAVGFTGSRGGGLALAAIAAKRPEPIPVYAEMSSINPVLLLPSALTNRSEELARGYVASVTLGSGQFCTNPGIVLAVDGPDLDRFLATVGEVMAQVPAAPMLTANIHAVFKKGVDALSAHPDVTRVAIGAVSDGPTRSPAEIFVTTAEAFRADPHLADEVFGASSLVIRCTDLAEVQSLLEGLEGQLTATLHLDDADLSIAEGFLPVLEDKVGRIIVNGWPTNVEVSPAMVHGGPYPATSDSRTTSVGTMAIRRFLRPVSYQNFPQSLLPVDLRTA